MTSSTSPYLAIEPTAAEVASLKGATVLEFGAPWCGYCQRAQPLIEAALADSPRLHHLKIEDGQGRPLGRSYRVKLWPTLIFLRDGAEIARTVRPTDVSAIREALSQLFTETAHPVDKE
jgi:thioredoxin 1